MNVKSAYLSIRNKREIKYDNSTEEEQNKNDEAKPKEYKETEEVKNNETEISEGIWQIEIPKINLIAPIEEGTTEEIMNKYVGHFENTEKWIGNIGLAAHNRRISGKLFCKVKRIRNW